MWSWLGHNIGWLLVLAGLIVAVVALVAGLVRARKSGKSSCAGCAGCAYAKNCPSNRK